MKDLPPLEHRLAPRTQASPPQAVLANKQNLSAPICL